MSHIFPITNVNKGRLVAHTKKSKLTEAINLVEKGF